MVIYRPDGRPVAARRGTWAYRASRFVRRYRWRLAAAAVLALLGDPERRERLSRAARRFAESRYDWRMIVPLLERVYEA